MHFELSVLIDRPPSTVFVFLRDIDHHPREEGSGVLLLDKVTDGPAGVGSRYREVVQMLPFVRSEFLSEITRFEPDEWLGMRWQGGGMKGTILYHFEAHGGGTRLTQVETVSPQGLLILAAPVIKLSLGRALMSRLEDIKAEMEAQTGSLV